MTTESSAQSLRGAPVAKTIRGQIVDAIAATGTVPCLVNIVVGDDQASGSYLDAIDRLAAKLGIESRRTSLPAGAGEAAVLAALEQAARDSGVHALMVQLPLPDGVDGRRVAAQLPPAKDADGITAASLGAVLSGVRQHTAPATAAAVVELLASDERLDPAGREVAIVGRSLVVGRPLAAMLASRGPGGDATVTLCHTRTPDLAAHTRRADIVVVAAGVQGMLKPDMIHPGAIVIDVGIHALPSDGGWSLAGDVDPAVAEVAGFLTPVPGGLGPVTNAVLMRHVTAAACPDYLRAAW